MKWSSRHDREKAPRSALLGSVTVHGVVAVLAVVLAISSPPAMQFETFEIELVSLPPSQIAEIDQPALQPEDLQVQTPDPTPIEEPPPLPDPDLPPVAVEPPPDSVPPEPVEEPEEVVTPPDSTVNEVTPPTRTDSTVTETSETGEDIAVRMEGLRRDFPVYYENIIRQIGRCFRPPTSARTDLRAVVHFVIRADGTVSEQRLVERSGVTTFDISALSAIGDCAGTGRFGPLPDDLGYERLPIQFEFRPRGEQASTSSDAA